MTNQEHPDMNDNTLEALKVLQAKLESSFSYQIIELNKEIRKEFARARKYGLEIKDAQDTL